MVEIIPENSFSSRLGAALGGGIQQGIGKAADFAAQMQLQKNKAFSEQLAKSPGREKIVESLISHGVSPEDAELYSYLTAGGQTAFVKDILEQKKRQQRPSFQKLVEQEQNESPIKERTPEQEEAIELQEILRRQDEGLTPAERVARGKERYTTGLKVYQESGTKIRGAQRDKERLEMLTKLNDSDKLPKGFARLNVDKEGNLRLPFASSPEAQRYTKILNEFSANAKDTFGTRVTNFDLAQYLKRFPTLLNSKEGRKQLLQQMKIFNDINSIFYKNLKDVYDKAGGVRAIDSDIAEGLAEKKSEKKIEELIKKFYSIGELNSLPSAQEHRGQKIRDTETGQILISDGEQWVPQE